MSYRAEEPAAPVTPRRIEMILPSLVTAGMEVLVVRLVRRLRERGHDVGVTCVEARGALAEELAREGVPVVLAPAPGLRTILRAPELESWLARRAPDVVHVHSGAWLKAAGAARRVGVPRIIATVHGLVSPEPWHGPALMHWAARRSHQVVAVSESLATYLHESCRIARRKLHVVVNGIDTERFAPGAHSGALRRELALPADALVVGHVARLDPVKNQMLLLEAFAQLRRLEPRARLVLIGDGALRPALEARVDALDLRAAVHMPGERADLTAVYHDFDLFVLSSHTEGTSMSILEAMASGVPVVATAVGGTPALLDGGRCGRLVPPDDPTALAAAMAALLRDAPARAELATVARSYVDTQFSETGMVARYEALYGCTLAAASTAHHFVDASTCAE